MTKEVYEAFTKALSIVCGQCCLNCCETCAAHETAEDCKSMFVTSRVIEIAEDLGWSCDIEEDGYAEFSQQSPAGEDFSFSTSIEFDEPSKYVRLYYEGFDPEEHVLMWLEAKKNGTPGVPSVYDLVHDADDIEKMLEELSDALMEVDAEV